MSENRQALAEFFGVLDPVDSPFQKISCPHPDHLDENPSFEITYDASKKTTRVRCRSRECDLSEQLTAAGVKFKFWDDSGSHTVQDKVTKAKDKGVLTDEYEYVDASGNLLYVVERYLNSEGKKGFAQRQPDGTRSLKGVTRVLYRLPEVLKTAADGGTVYVCEGEKDADRLRSMGLTATTNAQGASAPWQESFSDALEGAHVIVIADKDEPGYKHAKQVLASVQKSKAASVRVLQAKTGKDASDHLDAGHGLRDFEDCPLEIAPHDYDPNSFFNPGMGLAAMKLRDAVLEFGQIVPDDTGLLWSYSDGVYRPDGEMIVRRRCAALLRDRYRREHAGTVLDMLGNVEPLWNDDTLDSNFINLPNGLMEWKTGKLRAHSPHVASIARIPIEWHEDATCPEIDKWLRDIFPAGDCNEFIYEIAGYMLYNKQPLHKAIMLSGSGRNGKGTLLRLFKQLVGIENISAVTPQALDENRFSGSRLCGKLANLCGDVNAKTFKATEAFKQATGEDYMTVERKGQDSFEFTVRALLIAAFNELPRTNDTTEGYFSRWIVVPFTRRFSEKEADRGLDGRLQAPEEMQGFLVQAVKGLRRLMERGNFELPPSVLGATQHFRRSTDPVQSFLWETVIPEEGSKVKRSEIYARYKSWAEENSNGYKQTKSKFLGQVSSAGSQLFDCKIEEPRRTGGEYYFHGLAWKPEESGAVSEDVGAKLPHLGQKQGVFEFTTKRSVHSEMKKGSVLPQTQENCPNSAFEAFLANAMGASPLWRKTGA